MGEIKHIPGFRRAWRCLHFCLLILSCCFFFFFLFHATLFQTRHLDPQSGGSLLRHAETVCVLSIGSMNYIQDSEERIDISGARRLLSRPGSWPPRCNSKCGRCTPCRPVHVAVPPGTPVTAEYYPEAWRCKCSNKLYVP